jgi:hypothetical protein
VRFPGDDELQAAILKRAQYGRMPQPRLRLILAELEMASRDQFDEATGLREDLSIEHILPDHWTTYWRIADGTAVPSDLRLAMTETQLQLIDEREGLKHTLGNLTLLTPPANTEAKNYDFQRKRARLRTSLLAMNQDIAEQRQWSEIEIRKRGERLGNLATRIWPAPGGPT